MRPQLFDMLMARLVAVSSTTYQTNYSGWADACESVEAALHEARGFLAPRCTPAPRAQAKPTTVPRRTKRLSVGRDGRLRDPSGAIFYARGLNWGKRSMTKEGRTIYNSSDAQISRRMLPSLNHIRLVLDYYDPSGVCQTDIFLAHSPATGFIRPAWLAFIDDAVRWTHEAGLWIALTLRNNYGTASPHGQKTTDIPCDGDYIGNSTAR